MKELRRSEKDVREVTKNDERLVKKWKGHEMKWDEERERCKEKKWKDTLILNDLDLSLAFFDFIFWFPSYTPFSTLGFVIWPPYHSHQGFHTSTFSY